MPMEKFTCLAGRACPLPLPNLDTDQLLPARFLKWSRDKGLGQALLRDLRFDADDRPVAGFPLNDAVFAGARVLVAGRNFGGGSSREAAVYAVHDYGFRCVVAPSFGDIFAQNAVKNGLLAAVVGEAEAAELAAAVATHPEREIVVDLAQQTIVFGNLALAFTIDPNSRDQLLHGWDDVDLTEQRRPEIDRFRSCDAAARPWAVPRR
jgi:3-isopropylmalate/(R)-2-methylmalate dehydratase small subunit